ncbi:MAG: LON peptidase substrate-binding domain-containing protein, partial [SAR86 cluster bacterium]|nr:LON peptidase substrate-binding domain-containing protein [SAR86 cluster bacterium]
MPEKIENLPLLPLRDVVIFPSVVTPLFVGREKSMIALQAAMAADKQIMLVAQKDAEIDDPDTSGKDIFKVGTVSTILQLIKLPDGTVKVLVEGNKRANLDKVKDFKEYLAADISLIEDQKGALT